MGSDICDIKYIANYHACISIKLETFRNNSNPRILLEIYFPPKIIQAKYNTFAVFNKLKIITFVLLIGFGQIWRVQLKSGPHRCKYGNIH